MSRTSTPLPETRKHTWALVVATYQRHDILQECLARALRQTCPPQEVIIVDASPGWERSRDVTLGVHAPRNPGVRFEHVQAERASIANQRNQGISLARADVLFMLDDDSMMHPRCAEHILAVYDADTGRELAGVQARVVDDLEGEAIDGKIELKASGLSRWQWIRGSRIVELFYSRLLLMSNIQSFLPYEGAFPGLRVPASVAHLEVEPVHLFWGCAMSFRREVISQVRFESHLLRYCPGEDLDGAYRASLRGPLLVAGNAHLLHLAAAGGRTNRFVTAALSATNQAFLLRKYGTDQVRDRSRYRRLMARRLLAEGLKDGLSGRWSFPQFRAIVYSLGVGNRLFRMPLEDLGGYYEEFQQQLLARR